VYCKCTSFLNGINFSVIKILIIKQQKKQASIDDENNNDREILIPHICTIYGIYKYVYLYNINNWYT